MSTTEAPWSTTLGIVATNVACAAGVVVANKLVLAKAGYPGFAGLLMLMHQVTRRWRRETMHRRARACARAHLHMHEDDDARASTGKR